MEQRIPPLGNPASLTHLLKTGLILLLLISMVPNPPRGKTVGSLVLITINNPLVLALLLFPVDHYLLLLLILPRLNLLQLLLQLRSPRAHLLSLPTYSCLALSCSFRTCNISLRIQQGELLTPQVQAYVSKVYRFMAGMTGAAIAGGVVGAAVGFPPLIGFLGGLGCLLGVMFTSREKVRLREWLGYGFGALQGASVGMFVSLFSPGVVAAAALGTLAIFGGFSLAALRAERAAYIKYAGVMFGALIFLVLAGLGGMLASYMGWASAGFMKALYNINLWFGLGLFSLFISFDTQRMIDSAYQGITDHVSDALNMFMNLFNIFIRLLQIFGGRDE
eukprot:TRINITY_DN453_c0_g1_i1.p1 TRINITY_DN453_c0_g1~~TRINITY_DN453_c0_g1_i1.p1  ORF type:complete len:334 (+),score=51.66 TRINITY_DN453_c0_g1_i1:555-1556(+)